MAHVRVATALVEEKMPLHVIQVGCVYIEPKFAQPI
jgi:hypothetical protein